MNVFPEPYIPFYKYIYSTVLALVITWLTHPVEKNYPWYHFWKR